LEDIVTTPLGSKIRELRKKKGWTLEDLADKTDSSKSYIWELENKNPPRPSAEKIGRIALELGVTADQLMIDSVSVENAGELDKVFFRNYQSMGDKDKEKLRELVELWNKKD
jgi:transcriptional regulator with XRE-family HTH domain